MDLPEEILRQFAPATETAIAEALAACGFDPQAYVALHDDLRGTGISDFEAIDHWFRHGVPEGRLIPASPRVGDYLPLLRLPIADMELRRVVLHQFWTNQERVAGEATDWAADVTAVSNALFEAGALPYVILGDSHSHCYSKPIIHDDMLLAPIHMLCSGGSAMGLVNARSRSGYGNAIRDFLARQAAEAGNSNVRFLFKFGQVDAEFTFIFRRIRARQTSFSMAEFERFAQESIARYRSFLHDVLTIFPHPERIKVCGIFPPALADETWHDGYVNAHIAFLETGREARSLARAVRAMEIPDLLTRTRMHALYNGYLQVACAQLGVVFIDDFNPLLSGAGVVDRAWTGPHEGRDHHLAPLDLAPVIGTLIRTHATPRPWGEPPYAFLRYGGA